MKKTLTYTSGNKFHKFTVEVERLTVRELFDALEKNGFEHARGEWYTKDKSGKIVGGCALQQMALNLSVAASVDDAAKISYTINDTGDYEVNNFLAGFSILSQLDRFNVSAKSRWYMEAEGRGLGSTIIAWNDRKDYDAVEGYKFALPTYQGVVNMARELMQPYFDRYVYLLPYAVEAIRKEEVLVPA